MVGLQARISCSHSIYFMYISDGPLVAVLLFLSIMGSPGPSVAAAGAPGPSHPSMPRFSTTGYWLVASDGGVFSFGDAQFFGSMGGKPLARPIVGVASTADGGGYWLVASDGGVFSFGDAHFFGSAGGSFIGTAFVGIVATSTSHGYWIPNEAGGLFDYGDAQFLGSCMSQGIAARVVGMTAS